MPRVFARRPQQINILLVAEHTDYEIVESVVALCNVGATLLARRCDGLERMVRRSTLETAVFDPLIRQVCLIPSIHGPFAVGSQSGRKVSVQRSLVVTFPFRRCVAGKQDDDD